MRILQVNTADKAGGAEAVAWQLFQAYRDKGYHSSLLVGYKRSQDPDVHELEHDAFRGVWCRLCAGLSNRLGSVLPGVRGLHHVQTALRFAVGQPGRWYHRMLGREDFDYPGTQHLLRGVHARPDVIHCHNLHGGGLKDGGYFDLRVLPGLSRRFPLVVTLHDAWLLSGHCAHSFDCDRWKQGCGACPDLTIYPAVKRDATAYNWRRKRDIFARCRLFVATPSRWLMEKVEASIVGPAIVEQRVIPNGVDLSVFSPKDKAEARTRLGLPLTAKILLFVANGIKENVWKDFKTMREALSRVSVSVKGHELLLIALGDEKAAETIGSARVQFVPYEHDPKRVALYYQAADVYLHAARADTFPNTVMEAAACGTPVVATAVGGIPEQIVDGRSGFLVPAGDAGSMSHQTRLLLEQESRHRMISAEAAHLARERFDFNRQVQAYLEWYEDLIRLSSGKGMMAYAH